MLQASEGFVFWDVMPCTLVASYQHREICSLYHSSTLKMVAAGFCVTLLTVRVHVITHQKTVMFIINAISASFHAYVQAVSCGIEHSSVCKKVVHYYVLLDVLGEKCM
jgi:predicted permease